MAFNKMMHPRNPYKDKPPNFNELAEKYSDFRSHCFVAPNGKLSLNFRSLDAIRCLARTMLHNDFGLSVELPSDCLVPRVPQRLNYILFIDDLLSCNHIKNNVIGIDIGTGASCIYALLGAKQCGWRFLATESDEYAAKVASGNVRNNQLIDLIEVVKVRDDRLIKDLVRGYGNLEFTFCMCNPPFYGEDEAETKFVQLDESNKAMENKCYEVTKRSAPHSATIGRRNELSVTGGEVGFVGRLIEDSFVLQNSVKFYTSMIGKKASLNELTRKLKEYGNVHYAVSTLSQGRTQRWVLTWSFDANLKLSMNSTECSPLTVPLPASVPLCCPDECYSTMKRLLNFLEIKFEENEKSELICEAKHDTWSNQRQKRRLNDRLMSSLTSHKSNEEPLRKKKRFSERIQSDNCGVNASQDIGVMVNLGVGNGCDSLSNDGNFNFIASECHSSCQTDVAIQVYLPSSSLPLSSSSSVTSVRSVCDQSLVRFRLTANIFEKRVELRWIDGSRHRLYQISQYIKNQVSHFIDDQ